MRPLSRLEKVSFINLYIFNFIYLVYILKICHNFCQSERAPPSQITNILKFPLVIRSPGFPILTNKLRFCSEKKIQSYTVEPRFNEPLFNEVLDITNDILCPGQSYSKMYGIEPRYNKYFDITNNNINM